MNVGDATLKSEEDGNIATCSCNLETHRRKREDAASEYGMIDDENSATPLQPRFVRESWFLEAQTKRERSP